MNKSNLEQLNRSDLLIIAQGVLDRLDGLVHRSRKHSKMSTDEVIGQLAFQTGYLETSIQMILRDIYKVEEEQEEY